MGAFDASVLVDRAVGEAKLDDFGDDTLSSTLERLCTALDLEAGLTPQGIEALAVDINRMLVNRLRVHDTVKCVPAIEQAQIAPPIVILGLPRTGTTKLQRMLSADPALQPLTAWRMRNPAPFPDAPPGEVDPRIIEAKNVESAMLEFSPGVMAAHAFLADDVEEDNILMLATFRGLGWMMLNRLPEWGAWASSQDFTDCYRFLQIMLKFMQWETGGNPASPWVLKSPLHIGYLPELSSVFPGAVLVHCHRDPAEVMASWNGLIEQLRLQTSEAVDRKEFGHQQLTFWSERLATHLAQREEPLDLRFVDVRYTDIVGRPFDVVEEIYRIAGIELTPAAEQAMGKWLHSNEQHRFGRHRYTLADYALDEVEVNAAFQSYRDAFSDFMR